MGKVNESKVDYWLSDDGLMLIEAWSRDGITQDDLAGKLGVKRETLWAWRKQYPEIDKAIKTSKEIIDYKVENALLKAALGFTTKEIKVTIGKKPFNGEMFELLKETTTKEVAPNVTACMAWLNNRKHDQWKRNRDKLVDADIEDQNITISIVRGPKEDRLPDNVNQEVKFEPGKPKQKELIEVDVEDNDEDMSCWDDWDEEEDYEDWNE